MRGYQSKGMFIIIVFILFFCLFYVQDSASQTSGVTLGGYQWGGDIELGYRFTDIDGRDRYKEVFNLMDGLRLFDLSLWGKDLDQKGLVDYFNFNLNGIGDPYPSGRLEIKKNKSYDVVATYKEFKYFFDRTDTTLTDNLNFNSRNRRGTLTVSLFPTDDFRLNFGYGHAWREGDGVTSRFSVFPFTVVPQDFDEQLNDYFVSADFPIGGWDFHVKQSFWNFQNKNDITAPTLFERRDEKVSTYVSTIKAHTQFGDRWDLDTGYVYAYSKGQADLLTAPAFAVTSGDGDFNFNTHVFELGLSYLLMKPVILHLDYRFHRLDQSGRSDTDLLISAPANVPTDYNLVAHTGTFQVEWLPQENLTLRGGYRVQYRDINGENLVRNAFDGGEHPNNTNILAHSWIASADWKPLKVLSLYGEYQGANFDNPYTRISPESENIAKVKVKYDTPITNLSLKGSVLWQRKVNPDQEFRVDTQDYVLTAAYQPVFIPRLSLDASVTYERILDKKDIYNFTPGLFNTFVFDQNALIYSGGITYEIYKGLGARFYGSYGKTWKETGQRYTDGVLSIWYKNKWVTPIVTVERTYLIDRDRRSDSYDANLLTLSLRKEF
jgi:hypothetical protein